MTNRDKIIRQALANYREIWADWLADCGDGSWDKQAVERNIAEFADIVEYETEPFPVDVGPNDIERINAIWCWISTDATGEGVCSGPLMGPGTFVPLIAADEKRLRHIRPWAERIAEATKLTLRLIRLSTREVVDEIKGRTN